MFLLQNLNNVIILYISFWFMMITSSKIVFNLKMLFINAVYKYQKRKNVIDFYNPQKMVVFLLIIAVELISQFRSVTRTPSRIS